jgi:glyceraldehyde 3-phosphate dehydrogenase
MAIKVAINGFGRIGRNVARAISNGLTAALNSCRSTTWRCQGQRAAVQARQRARRLLGDVSVDGSDLIVNGKRIR